MGEGGRRMIDQRHARYIITQDPCLVSGGDFVIQDMGPWDEFPTIANDAEWVVLSAGCLFYSDGVRGELLHDGVRFTGFGHVD